MTRIEKGPGWELRLGDYREVLADVTECDAVITDPPYSERTHGKRRHGRRSEVCGSALGYAHMTVSDIEEFTNTWASSTKAWCCIFNDSKLQANIRASMRQSGLTVFAPLPVVLKGMNVRLSGDGPSNWCVWLCVGRTKAAHKWGTLRGAYVGSPSEPGRNKIVVGSKPLWLMRQIVRDYSRKGDLIVDPCAGGATTLLAAVMEGRRAIGAEIDPETFDKAVARLRKGYTPNLPGLGL